MPSRLRAIQILLTITALEFFGPAIRDISHSHLLNASWVGHARLHLVWLLGFMVFSGLANLYFIWRSAENKRRDLGISAIWQACNLAGFWVATIAVDSYGGAIVDPEHHVAILGMDENVFVFFILTVVYLIALVLLAKMPGDGKRS
uniref:hypothetical protein n=1 Tax=Parerythrobacter lutipelagi TaxID=1964208 RepID=UPI0010FA05DE|nr:hypothetical protein [Parerythrobacter lutipelagi]